MRKQQDILAERKEIMELLKSDAQEYPRRINRWNIARVERLQAVDWRKAQAA